MFEHGWFLVTALTNLILFYPKSALHGSKFVRSWTLVSASETVEIGKINVFLLFKLEESFSYYIYELPQNMLFC